MALKINQEITVKRVRVIDQNGQQMGILSVEEALARTAKLSLDLVEVAPHVDPPVCKIVDYKKLKFQQSKKEKQKRRVRQQGKIKGMRLKPNISSHDVAVKMKQVREFLSKGNKVRISCLFRGRERAHPEHGKQLLEKVCAGLADIATLEAPLKMVGRSMIASLSPHTKKRNHENPSGSTSKI